LFRPWLSLSLRWVRQQAANEQQPFSPPLFPFTITPVIISTQRDNEWLTSQAYSSS
jgi:hypothetical protein